MSPWKSRTVVNVPRIVGLFCLKLKEILQVAVGGNISGMLQLNVVVRLGNAQANPVLLNTPWCILWKEVTVHDLNTQNGEGQVKTSVYTYGA